MQGTTEELEMIDDDIRELAQREGAVDLGRLEPLKRRTTKAILAGLGLNVEGKRHSSIVIG